MRTHRSVPNQRQMLSLLAGDAECFRVLSSPNPAAQGQHNVCGSGYGADPQDLALLCAPAISSCQHLHLWGAFDRTTEASPASKQSGCTRVSVPPPPRRQPSGDQLNAAPILANFPSQYHSCTLLAPLAQKFLPWDQFLNRGSERLGQLPEDTQLLIRGGVGGGEGG